MYRVLLDSNILLSGLFFDGNERKILEAGLEKKIQLVIPETVALEIKSIVERKSAKLANVPKAIEMLERILENAVVIPEEDYIDKAKEAKQIIRDIGDAPILAAVLSIKHDYFVSGDKDFQVLSLPTHVSAKGLLNKIKTEKRTKQFKQN